MHKLCSNYCMKKLLSLLSISLFYFSVHAQNANATISEEFKQLSSETGANHATTGYENIQTFKNGDINGSQFFYPGWVKGSVTTTDNKAIESDNYLFLFDKVRQVLFIKYNTGDDNNNSVMTADNDKLKAFTLITDKPHSFISASAYDLTLKNDFFEVLVQDNNYTLLKLNKASFEKADEHDMLAMKNGDFSDAFVDHSTYYIYHNSKLEKINLQQYSIRKNLKDQKAKVDAYFDMHQNEEMSEGVLVNLINYLNT